ncbi:MAG: hypothetical protein KJ938_12620 [Actinobacteria bacterium]|nr:hypothetical protein [Actinomycetota bacterium]
MKSYGHKLGDLLDAVENLDLSVVSPPVVGSMPSRPVDDLDPTLTEMLERFANGAGRYEHLDSLWDENADVATLETWTGLCGRVTPSKRVHDLTMLRTLVLERLQLLSTYGHLEGSTHALLDALNPHLSDLSTSVSLRLYEKARWVASALDIMTYYTNQELPLLGEAVQNIKTETELFFQYSVARIEDEQATIEDLDCHFEHFAHLSGDDGAEEDARHH